MKRSPIIVVMGHVDHGKTTLLDYIRKTNLASREAGGITQSIGAYEIEHKELKMTFIDTPGHQAFSNMRRYGARVADIAILIVAADDGVEPQTKEAIGIINAEKMPFVVAINKIDKSNANIEKTKNELLQAGVLLEKYGGNISWQEISAKTGEGVPELLDLLSLTAEVEDLKYEPEEEAYGIILRSTKDDRRGITVGGVLKNGTLKTGQNIFTKTASGKIKQISDFLGGKTNEASPSSPVSIIGFEEMPQAGEEFWASFDTARMEEMKAKKIKEEKPSIETANDSLNLVLKSDETASLEALKTIILHTDFQAPVKIIQEGVGNITENDVKNAAAFNALVLGFKTKTDKSALNLAKTQKINIIESPIVYELEKEIKGYIQKAAPKEMRRIEILKTFGTPKGKEQIVGGAVILGPIKNQEQFEIWSDKRKIGEGKILNLQSQKKDLPQAETGVEVGLLVESRDPIKEKNILIFPS
ncbi:GTP-binding protein [Patescibacteria group bacterium]|nr:GTP-binding protein [Patescibacteria group bacterium]